MLHHFEPLPPLNLQLVSNLADVYTHSPGSSDGHAARVHAARKSAFLSMSPACNFEAFSLHFHLPLKVAAEKFGVRATAFKKRCRAIGIRHWPYRKVRSLKRSLHELHRCREQAPLSDKQQAQYTTFKRQLDKLMAPETYGLDPSGRLGPNVLSDDEDVESEDGNDSFASSPRVGNDGACYDCTVSPTDRDNKSMKDVLPAGAFHLRMRRSQVVQLPPSHLTFKSEDQDFDYAPDGLKMPLTNKKVDGDDFPSSGFNNAEFDFLPSETKYIDVRSLNDADEEFTAHASHVDYSSDRFFDDVFLQISPDYGCLV